MTKLSQWAKTLDLLWRLNGIDDCTGLFKSQERIGNGVPCYNYTTPVYHVWVDDKWVCSTTNYAEAYNIYESRLRERQYDNVRKV